MKSFFRYFSISIISSGLLIYLSHLFSFTPLDAKQGSPFSNGFITGLALIGWVAFKLRPNQSYKESKMDILYGVHDNIYDPATKPEKYSNTQIPAALGLLLSGAINMTLSFLL